MLYVKASQVHVADIVKLVNIAYRSKEQAGWTSEADLVQGDRINEQQVMDLLGDESTILMLLQAEVVIGCVHLQASNHSAYIGMLTIHPSAQNQGIGQQLLQLAEQYIIDHYSVDRFHMSVLAARTELIAFYQRRGYQLTAQIDDYPIDANIGQPLQENLTVLHLLKTRSA